MHCVGLGLNVVFKGLIGNIREAAQYIKTCSLGGNHPTHSCMRMCFTGLFEHRLHPLQTKPEFAFFLPSFLSFKRKKEIKIKFFCQPNNGVSSKVYALNNFNTMPWRRKERNRCCISCWLTYWRVSATQLIFSRRISDLKFTFWLYSPVVTGQ